MVIFWQFLTWTKKGIVIESKSICNFLKVFHWVLLFLKKTSLSRLYWGFLICINLHATVILLSLIMKGFLPVLLHLFRPNSNQTIENPIILFFWGGEGFFSHFSFRCFLWRKCRWRGKTSTIEVIFSLLMAATRPKKKSRTGSLSTFVRSESFVPVQTWCRDFRSMFDNIIESVLLFLAINKVEPHFIDQLESFDRYKS